MEKKKNESLKVWDHIHLSQNRKYPFHNLDLVTKNIKMYIMVHYLKFYYKRKNDNLTLYSF